MRSAGGRSEPAMRSKQLDSGEAEVDAASRVTGHNTVVLRREEGVMRGSSGCSERGALKDTTQWIGVGFLGVKRRGERRGNDEELGFPPQGSLTNTTRAGNASFEQWDRGEPGDCNGAIGGKGNDE